MSEKKKEENCSPPCVTEKLCDERVKRIEGKIDDLREDMKDNLDDVKDNLKTVDKRVWWVLGSVVALGLIAILISLLRH